MKLNTPLGFLVLLSLAGLQAQTVLPNPAPDVPRDPLFYLYNPRLDALGQDLQKAAGEVANGQVYETQLSNLDAIAKLSTERIFSSGRRGALAKIEAARTWRRLWTRVEAARLSMQLTESQKAEWTTQAAALEAQSKSATKAASDADTTLKDVADLLDGLGKAKQIAQAGSFLQRRDIADITPADLRAAAKLQAMIGNVGSIVKGLAADPALARSSSVADQMKVELAKAEIDYLKTLVGVEEKRLAGQQDVSDLLAAISSTLVCPPAGSCTLKFTSDDGAELPPETIPGSERLEDTLQRLRTDKPKLAAVVYLLQNYAALAARAELPLRLAELRSAIEERRFAIRKEAIMARSYEQILLLGAQRIAAYYKGGIKPETLAQFASALSTAGLIPTIALK